MGAKQSKASQSEKCPRSTFKAKQSKIKISFIYDENDVKDFEKKLELALNDATKPYFRLYTKKTHFRIYSKNTRNSKEDRLDLLTKWISKQPEKEREGLTSYFQAQLNGNCELPRYDYRV